MSYLPNVRWAVRHVDEAVIARATRYHVWALAGWLAILAAAYFGADRIMPIVGPYLPGLDVVPGFRALPQVLIGDYCQPSRDAVRLAYGMFLIFIPYSWLIYVLRIGPRYVKALRKVIESLAPSEDDRADRRLRAVVIDFGWSRDRYCYPSPILVGLYLMVALAVLIDSLWFPHLIQLGCAGSHRALPWLVIEVVFGGLLAIMAPHAVVLLRQASMLRRGRRS